jgi:chromosomal replication initiation ATPase DnaA
MSVLKAADEIYENRTIATLVGLTIEKLILSVAEGLHVHAQTVKSPSKERAVARAKGIICYLARDHLGMNGVEIGRSLGLTPSAVCKSAQRGRDDPLRSEFSWNVLATIPAATEEHE